MSKLGMWLEKRGLKIVNVRNVSQVGYSNYGLLFLRGHKPLQIFGDISHAITTFYIHRLVLLYYSIHSYRIKNNGSKNRRYTLPLKEIYLLWVTRPALIISGPHKKLEYK